MWVDEQWITYQKGLGKNFKDVGAPDDALRPPDKDPLEDSEYYNMELKQMEHYPGYSQDLRSEWLKKIGDYGDLQTYVP